MPKFRKKPVVIEACQFIYGDDPFGVINVLEPMADVDPRSSIVHGKHWVSTLEGPLIVSPGDWIIKGVKGEFYPCKPDIFAATYEEVKEPIPTQADTDPRAEHSPRWVKTWKLVNQLELRAGLATTNGPMDGSVFREAALELRRFLVEFGAEPTPNVESYDYLARLFTHYAPQCKPLPTLLGLCTQIDNLLVALTDTSTGVVNDPTRTTATCARSGGIASTRSVSRLRGRYARSTGLTPNCGPHGPRSSEMKVKCANCGVMGGLGRRVCPFAPDGPEGMDAASRRYISCALEDGSKLATQIRALSDRMMAHACEPGCDNEGCVVLRDARDVLMTAAAALEYRAKE